MSEAPLPCPFCDGKKLAFFQDVPSVHTLMCDNDHCPVNVVAEGKTADEALEHWNRRAVVQSGAPQPDKAPVNPVDAVRFPCSMCGKPADGHSHTIRATTTTHPDPGTDKLLRTLLDRAYKMMLMSGYRVQEQNPDHNDPIIAWMSDARAVLYGSGRQPDLGTLT